MLPRMLPPGLGEPGGTEAAGQPFNHAGVAPGQCKTCHDGLTATARPARHVVTSMSCDQCHRTTTWLPAQYGHQGVARGTCLTCHNGLSAPGKPANHFVTARSCDSCHRTLTWSPAEYTHLSPLYKPAPDKTRCVACHVTNGEMIPRQLRAGPRPRPVPIPIPPN
jgi:hypothetical protein